VPFSVSVTGLDNDGNTYERLFPTMVRPQTVLVGIAPATVDNRLPIGRSTEFVATVRNIGEKATFQLRADATLGSVDAVFPDTLTLNTDEVGTFVIRLTLPVGTANETQVFLIATVTNAVNLTSTNSATLDLVASPVANMLPIANAGPNQKVRVHTPVTLNGSGSLDPDNGPAPLKFEWVQLNGPAPTTLSDAMTSAPSLTPRLPGAYTFGLVVSDGEVKSVPSQVTVVVEDHRHRTHE
jgi:hypothetical protein